MIPGELESILKDEILETVSKPARYLGSEVNAIRKDWEQVRVKVALAFPDSYEVGMSHLGLKILYHLLNQAEDILAERVYAPWPDLEEALRSRGLPLFSLENYRPLDQFDIIGFTLQYELSFPTILNMLDLAKVPLKGQDRSGGDPLVIAGGPVAFNPEPVAPFFDAILIGESEELLPKVIQEYQAWKETEKPDRLGLLKGLSRLPGVYVPAFYKPVYQGDGTLAKWDVCGDSPFPIRKQVLRDLEGAYYPENFIVPYLDIVHDRGIIEVFRGCTRGCRFCQAGMIYRPVRERRVDTLRDMALKIIDSTGFDELSLVSLSTGDYSGLSQLVTELLPELQARGVALSLPSLRIDSFAVELAKEIQSVRKTGLTFAPEAGTQRLRDVINKNVSDDDLLKTAEAAFRAGWHSLKLYFMIGLPTETMEDVEGIFHLSKRVADLGKRIKQEVGIGKKINVTASVSSFVPKPHTPFQWAGQESREKLWEKQRHLETLFRREKSLSLKYHDVNVSFVEGILSRGDRRIASLIEEVWRQGARLEGWSEFFSIRRWEIALEQTGISPEFYANRTREASELFPWEIIDAGVSKEYLWSEWQAGLEGKTSGDCRQLCSDCGVCPSLKVANRMLHHG